MQTSRPARDAATSQLWRRSLADPHTTDSQAQRQTATLRGSLSWTCQHRQQRNQWRQLLQLTFKGRSSVTTRSWWRWTTCTPPSRTSTVFGIQATASMQSAKCCHASTPWTTSSFRYSTLGNHWVTATNMFSRRPNTVYWCDSLHGTVSVLSMVQLTSLLRHHTDRPHHS